VHEHLTATYAILDPLLPREGKFLARWRLRLNVDFEEIVSHLHSIEPACSRRRAAHS